MTFSEGMQKIRESIARKTGLTADEIRTLSQVMNSVWQYVGEDFLQLNDGKDVRRSEVIEVVTDANRMEMICPKEADIIRKYYALDDKKKTLIDKHAFPFAKYGI
jgi:hypothetical protein